MSLMFGHQDEIDCLLPTTFAGPNNDQLCLAQHVSQYFVGAGVYVKDEGYVLKVTSGSGYYPVTDAQLKALQEEQTLPATLPPHHISTVQYLFGYSLWLILAGMALFAMLRKMFGKMRPFLAAQTVPVTGPPIGRTDWDRWLTTELGKQLEPGEKLQHQALATNFEPGVVQKGAKQLFLGLTDRRLLVAETQLGFSGLKREFGESGALPRDQIAQVAQNELRIQLTFADGSVHPFWIAGSQGKFSNQWLFARDVPKLIVAEINKKAA